MKKHYLVIFVLVIAAIMWLTTCSPIERINALRITEINFVGDGLQAEVFSEVIDTEKKKTASQHGFCWAINAVPQLGNAGVDSIMLGEKANEAQLFSAVIERLLPSTDYYIRSFMVVDGKTQYSLPQKIRTRDIRPEDVLISITNSFITNDSVFLYGIVNKERIEFLAPVTVTQYGTILASEPDSTKGISQVQTNFTPNVINSFTHKYAKANVPPPTITLPQPLQGSYFAWAFVDFYLNSNPSDVQRRYTRRLILMKR
ncbi:MAG: hypothetical protein NZ516_01500 [Raineya sp.]|nr:hypothetical protein [Raineya sp.]